MDVGPVSLSSTKRMRAKRTSANLLMSFLVSNVVELAIAEMACVSRNIRRTLHVPSGVPVQRSISERDCSHPVVVEFEKAETQAFLALSARLVKSLTAKLEPSSSLNAFSHILLFDIQCIAF